MDFDYVVIPALILLVGALLDTNGVQHGFLRTAGGSFSTIDFPGGLDTHPAGINDLGQIVGQYSDGVLVPICARTLEIIDLERIIIGAGITIGQ